MTDTYDSPWKDVLDRYLKDFFALLFPKIHAGVDWSRPPVSLEQELRKIVRDAELGKRLADKLFQVWRLDGTEVEVLINIEVQGTPDKSFAKRMYVYNYRAFDRFDRSVVSVAVLCDEGKNFHPKNFTACDLWDCSVKIDFPTVKLREYNERWDELEVRANPFSTVVMAHLKAQATSKRPEERYRWKLYLVRRLYERGYSKQDVLQLFSFIDWVILRVVTICSMKSAELLNEARRVGGHQIKKATVTEALEEYIQRRRQLEIFELFGQIDYDPDYDDKRQRAHQLNAGSATQGFTTTR